MQYSCEEIEMILEEYIEDKKDYVIISHALSDIAKALNIPDIRAILRPSNSKYLNDVLGFINGKQMGRINIFLQSNRIIIKLIANHEININERLTYDDTTEFLYSVRERLEGKVANF